MKLLTKIILLIIVIFVGLFALSGFYTDWLWFKDLGYVSLFWVPLISKLVIQVVNGVLLFLIIATTFLSVRHAIAAFYQEKVGPHLQNPRLQAILAQFRPRGLSPRRLTVLLLIIAALLSVAFSAAAGLTGWLDVLSFMNASDFHYADPVFGRDLSFFVFRLPFLQTVYNAFFPPLLLLAACTAVFYGLTGFISLRSARVWQKNAVQVDRSAKKHLCILCAVVYALAAFGFFLQMYSLFYSQQGNVVGAGYAQINFTLPVIRLLIVLSVLATAASLLTLIRRDFRPLLFAPVILLSVYFIGAGLLPSAVQALVVVPNELQKETPYIENEIKMTRFAYGLDKIEERDYTGTADITPEALENEKAIIDNVRLNDPRPMKQIYGQKQGIRQYYKFNDIDLDRYTINGDYRQVMLSVRELSVADLDTSTFVNTRLKYTHGFGAAASFANEVTSQGLPSFAINNIPPQSEFPELALPEPRVYFGELTNHWVIANSKYMEFDYPRENDNAENMYAGSTGIPFTFFNKLMLSFNQTTLRFFLSGDVTAESKMLLYRNIMERVRKLTPFLWFDPDAYAVIDEGRIKWIIDGYTTAATIPYGVQYGASGFNYIRNSVKAVVDAYHGTVDYYVVDPEDPLLNTYSKIFPGVFRPLSEISDSLRTHLRYPETMFRIQTDMLNTFHMTNPIVLYNKEDMWEVAKEVYLSAPINVDPYYVIMKLPEETDEEFVLIQPFTPASSETNARNNMIAWLAARMDGDNYGEILLYKLPKNIETYGPLQIESRIDQDPIISPQLTLWNQQGSQVIRGNLLALPIAGSFLFIEPVYLQSTSSGSIPEMRRVITAYKDEVVMTDTVDEALAALFGPATGGGESGVESGEGSGGSPPGGGEGTTTPPSGGDPGGGAYVSPEELQVKINEIRTLLDELEAELQRLSVPGEAGV
ncbi:MAG: UPF0182 family protein [Gracilibacteraceae bacterium]|jgi:uncharacterized membrane protein (UPF0182 family)|nr:UPF0182 family protein [Gracilibacteraceae bacterium]